MTNQSTLDKLKEVLRSKQMSKTNKRKKAFTSNHDFSNDVTPSGKCTLKKKSDKLQLIFGQFFKCSLAYDDSVGTT